MKESGYFALLLLMGSFAGSAIAAEVGPTCTVNTTNCRNTCKGDYGMLCGWGYTCDAVSHTCSSADKVLATPVATKIK